MPQSNKYTTLMWRGKGNKAAIVRKSHLIKAGLSIQERLL